MEGRREGNEGRERGIKKRERERERIPEP